MDEEPESYGTFRGQELPPPGKDRQRYRTPCPLPYPEEDWRKSLRSTALWSGLFIGGGTLLYALLYFLVYGELPPLR